MGREQEYAARVAELLAARAWSELTEYLVAHSNLPGPRGNLELAWGFADAVDAALCSSPWQARRWATLEAWLALDATQAPTGDAREFLPFCATLAMGCVALRVAAEQPASLAHVRRSANDPRWRLREAAAMALQRLGETRPVDLLAVLQEWMARATWLELRAVVAALAHPPLLADPAVAARALELAEAALASVALAATALRRSEEFRTLRQGLGYALSVLVVPAPEAGLEMLRRWAACADRDVRWILRHNLGKKRLQSAWPAEVAGLLAALER